jgi:hypothetical protein
MNFVTPTIAVWNEPRKPVGQVAIICLKFRAFFRKTGAAGVASAHAARASPALEPGLA